MPGDAGRIFLRRHPRPTEVLQNPTASRSMNTITNSELIILVGVPGSGKSTYAATYVAENPSAVIVGRDKLRELLFGYTEATVHAHYQSDRFREREEIITQFQHSAITLALQSGMTVIVDDTNCNYDRLKSLVDLYTGYEVSVQFFDTPLDECLRRNEQRSRVVPATTIAKYYESFLVTCERWNAKPQDNRLTETGFVFLDGKNTPFLIRAWDGDPWLFYWHADKRWVSARRVNQTEIWMYYEQRLPDTQAAMYHQLSERPY